MKVAASDSRPERRSHDLRRAELLSAAAAQFRRKGYSATTTRELAEELGIQKATLYYHVKRKRDLLNEICFAGLAQMYERVSAAVDAETEPDDRLKTLIRTHLETALGDRDIYWTMLMEFRSLQKKEQAEVAQSRAAYRAVLEKVISEAQSAGILRDDVEAHYLALALLNLLSWTIFWYQPGGTLTPGALADVYYRVFVDGARG